MIKLGDEHVRGVLILLTVLDAVTDNATSQFPVITSHWKRL